MVFNCDDPWVHYREFFPPDCKERPCAWVLELLCGHVRVLYQYFGWTVVGTRKAAVFAERVADRLTQSAGEEQESLVKWSERNAGAQKKMIRRRLQSSGSLERTTE